MSREVAALPFQEHGNYLNLSIDLALEGKSFSVKNLPFITTNSSEFPYVFDSPPLPFWYANLSIIIEKISFATANQHWRDETKKIASLFSIYSISWFKANPRLGKQINIEGMKQRK